MPKFRVHGYTFIRSGECARCGRCGCDGCPHYIVEHDKATCTIYDKRAEYCPTCETTHQICIDFPDHPWLHVIRDGVCAFTFERDDGGSMDDLPFLNGESWQSR